jgi:ribonucleoside-diphosphate reductase subunit M2
MAEGVVTEVSAAAAAGAASPTDGDDDDVEPLLRPDRLALYPIQYPALWELYKKAEASFWRTGEVDLTQDLRDWETLTPGEHHYIKHVLAFFAASDILVNLNLGANFLNEVQPIEARFFYAFQQMMENIHTEMYGLMLEAFVRDPDERHALTRALDTIPCVARKARFARRYMDRSAASFPERVVAFAAFEGIFFSTSFCAIFWLKKRGLMPGLTMSNEFISRDEGLHCDFACALYKMVRRKLTQAQIFGLISEAVEIECAFVRDALPVSLIGMNAPAMCAYVQFCADRLLEALGYGKLYGVRNPFDWMHLLSVDSKTNFFEHRVSAYALAGVSTDGAGATSPRFFSTTEDF